MIKLFRFLLLALALTAFAFVQAQSMETSKPLQKKSKADTSAFKKYLLGKFNLKYFPTEMNLFYGVCYSKPKYSSFDDFRSLYKDIYGVTVGSFRPEFNSTWGANFRILALGIELGKNKATYHSEAGSDELVGDLQGRRSFDLEINENTMAFFLGKRTKKNGFGLNIGGGFGKVTLKPRFHDLNGNLIDGPQVYLNGIFHTSYQMITMGPEYYLGYGRIKLTLRYDWSLRKLIKDQNFPNGIAIHQDYNDNGIYGPYIPRNYEGYSTPNSKAGAGDGRMYVGSDMRFNRLSLRLTYSLMYRQMPMNKKK